LSGWNFFLFGFRSSRVVGKELTGKRAFANDVFSSGDVNAMPKLYGVGAVIAPPQVQLPLQRLCFWFWFWGGSSCLLQSPALCFLTTLELARWAFVAVVALRAIATTLERVEMRARIASSPSVVKAHGPCTVGTILITATICLAVCSSRASSECAS